MDTVFHNNNQKGKVCLILKLSHSAAPRSPPQQPEVNEKCFPPALHIFLWMMLRGHITELLSCSRRTTSSSSSVFVHRTSNNVKPVSVLSLSSEVLWVVRLSFPVLSPWLIHLNVPLLFFFFFPNKPASSNSSLPLRRQFVFPLCLHL